MFDSITIIIGSILMLLGLAGSILPILPGPSLSFIVTGVLRNCDGKRRDVHKFISFFLMSGIHKKLAMIFLGETFRVLKEKAEREYGEYQMRRLILDAWFWRCEIG